MCRRQSSSFSPLFFTDALQTKLGRAKSLMFAEALMLTAYVMILCTPPFPVLVVAYLFLGYAMAINLALNNVLCANLAQSTIILGAAHGCYGVVSILGPIVVTSTVSKGLICSRYYFVPLSIRFKCIVFAGWGLLGLRKRSANTLVRSFGANYRSPRYTHDIPDVQAGAKKQGDSDGCTFYFLVPRRRSFYLRLGYFVSNRVQAWRFSTCRYVTAGFWVGRLGANALQLRKS